MYKWVTFNKVQQNSLGGNVGVAILCICVYVYMYYEEHSFGARGSDRFKFFWTEQVLVKEKEWHIYTLKTVRFLLKDCWNIKNIDTYFRLQSTLLEDTQPYFITYFVLFISKDFETLQRNIWQTKTQPFSWKLSFQWQKLCMWVNV